MSTWFHKTPADLTWSNFKKHFTDAHTNLIKVRGASMAHTLYEQTNNEIIKLTQEFVEMHSEVLGSVNALTNSDKEIAQFQTQNK